MDNGTPVSGANEEVFQHAHDHLKNIQSTT